MRFKILKFCFLTFFSLVYCIPVVIAEEKREECRLCGMWIDQYIHTRHVLTAEDGGQISFCSFTCAARYIKSFGENVLHLQVADYLTAELVDVGSAFYLLGSDAPPVMSYTSVIAFQSLAEADNFRKLHGGKIMTFAEVLDQK